MPQIRTAIALWDRNWPERIDTGGPSSQPCVHSTPACQPGLPRATQLPSVYAVAPPPWADRAVTTLQKTAHPKGESLNSSTQKTEEA